jgi:hypothetical protein
MLSLQGRRIFDKEVLNRHEEPLLLSQLAVSTLLSLASKAAQAALATSSAECPGEEATTCIPSAQSEARSELGVAIERASAIIATVERVHVRCDGHFYVLVYDCQDLGSCQCAHMGCDGVSRTNHSMALVASTTYRTIAWQ